MMYFIVLKSWCIKSRKITSIFLSKSKFPKCLLYPLYISNIFILHFFQMEDLVTFIVIFTMNAIFTIIAMFTILYSLYFNFILLFYIIILLYFNLILLYFNLILLYFNFILLYFNFILINLFLTQRAMA